MSEQLYHIQQLCGQAALSMYCIVQYKQSYEQLYHTIVCSCDYLLILLFAPYCCSHSYPLARLFIQLVDYTAARYDLGVCSCDAELQIESCMRKSTVLIEGGQGLPSSCRMRTDALTLVVLSSTRAQRKMKVDKGRLRIYCISAARSVGQASLTLTQPWKKEIMYSVGTKSQ